MKKSKRMSMVVTPTVYSDFKKAIFLQRLNANQVFSQLLEQYIKDNQEWINKYNQMYGDELLGTKH